MIIPRYSIGAQKAGMYSKPKAQSQDASFSGLFAASLAGG
jgi:hypothetical protein